MPVDPLTLGLKAGVSVIGGVGKAISAAKSRSPEEKERLEELRRLQEEAQFGLSEGERQGLEAALMTQRSAGLRQAQTIGEQQRQAAGGSGRELFLAEVAAQEAEQTARNEQAAIIGQQEIAATQAQQQELMALSGREAAARAAVVEGLTLGVVGAGDAAVGEVEAARLKEEAADYEAYKLEQDGVRVGVIDDEDLTALY